MIDRLLGHLKSTRPFQWVNVNVNGSVFFFFNIFIISILAVSGIIC